MNLWVFLFWYNHTSFGAHVLLYWYFSNGDA